jgi:sugar (pentulose or hexulose) kinase
MPSIDLLVGIDIGTTKIKATVVGADGHELCWGQVPTPWRKVASGAETDAAAILAAVLAAADSALQAAPPGDVQGVGVTSMAETLVLLDEAGRPVAPCIAWYDSRGEDELADLERVFGDEQFSARTGLAEPAICSLVKLAWQTRHNVVPIRRAFSIADWVVHRLGGEPSFEASLASRTGALSLAGRQWWAEGLAWAGAPADVFPAVAQAGEPVGKVMIDALSQAAEAGRYEQGALQRLIGAALTSAGHDHLSASVGAGALGRTQVLDSCGTAEGFVRTVAPLDGPTMSRAVSAGLSAGWHTVPGKYALLAGQSLGLLLEPVLGLLGVKGPGAQEALDDAARGVDPGSLHLAQSGGYGTVSVLELGEEASPEALWSAALSYSARGASRILEAMGAIAGPADELVLSGGWARCTGLREGRQQLVPRVRWPAVVEAGARGAALFGGCAAGLYAGAANFPVIADQPLR